MAQLAAAQSGAGQVAFGASPGSAQPNSLLKNPPPFGAGVS